MSINETFVDGLGNVAVQAALARIELTQLKSLPAEGQQPAFEVTSRLGIREIRSEITKAIEVEREAGKIGSSLQAELSIEVAASDFALLNSLGVDLRFVTITSKAEITQSNSNAMAITVKPSTAQKCARCWHHTSDVGSHSEHPDICGRCISNLYGEGEKRQFV